MAEFFTLCKFEVTNKGGLFQLGRGRWKIITTSTRLCFRVCTEAAAHLNASQVIAGEPAAVLRVSISSWSSSAAGGA